MSGASSVIDLSLGQLGLALLLVGVVVLVSLRQGLGLERDLLVGSVRTIVQLYLVGLILAAVFSAARSRSSDRRARASPRCSGA